jgi:hypothetical protein
MVLERIANPSIGESRFLGSSPSRSARFIKEKLMSKPTANYKMSKQTKAGLALHKFKDAHARGAWKRAMIDAELSAAHQPKREKSRRDSQGE